jgi:DNA-binding IclR family transcriptional regulator
MPPTANLSANSTLVQLAVALLKPAAQPSPAEIGAAVGTLLDTPAGPSGQCLADALPWWEAFRKLAAESPPAARTLAALRRDLVSYLLAGYATGELR